MKFNLNSKADDKVVNLFRINPTAQGGFNTTDTIIRVGNYGFLFHNTIIGLVLRTFAIHLLHLLPPLVGTCTVHSRSLSQQP